MYGLVYHRIDQSMQLVLSHVKMKSEMENVEAGVEKALIDPPALHRLHSAARVAETRKL